MTETWTPIAEWPKKEGVLVWGATEAREVRRVFWEDAQWQDCGSLRIYGGQGGRWTLTHIMAYHEPEPPELSEPLWWRTLVKLGKRQSHGGGLLEWEKFSSMRRWEIAGEIFEALIDRKSAVFWYPEKRSCGESVAVVDQSGVQHCVSVRSGDRPLAMVELAARLVGLGD